MTQTRVHNRIITKIDGVESKSTSVELNIREIEKAQELRYNSNEFNDWLSTVYGAQMTEVHEILIHVTQTPEIDFVSILESGRNISFQMVNDDDHEKTVIIGFNEASVTDQLISMVLYAGDLLGTLISKD